jgi:hypothetical protein
LYAEDEGMESGLKVWVQQSDNLTEWRYEQKQAAAITKEL